MKEYTKNKWFKKILILLVVIIMFNFTAPNIVKAADDDGGVLFTPIASLVAGIGDLVIQFMQLVFTGDGSIVGSELKGQNTLVTQQQEFITAVRNTTSFNELLTVQVPINDEGNSKALSELEDAEKKIKIYIEFEYNENGVLLDKYDKGRNSWKDFITDTEVVTDGNIGGLFTIASAEFQAQTGTSTVKIEKNYSIKYGPGIIFSGTIPAFDINFINPEHNTKDSSAVILRENVSGWYQTLQKLAIVGLLPVLVYIAIRIIISSTGKDKAKYKKMLTDWLVALCIIFILHYIMLFTFSITSSLNKVFKSYTVNVETGEDTQMTDLRNIIGDEDKWLDVWPEVLMYAILVIFSVTFSIQYLKRVIYMAFLTMIAPLIALTYPLDKIKDGQAQAFSMWIREYIFNALIQPVHLLLYAILVGGGVALTETYPLYGVIAVGFLVPAEKFFRKMFGFDKAKSVGTLGAIASGAVVMNLIKKAKNVPIPKGHKNENNEENSNIRTKKDPLDALRTNNSSPTTANATTQNATNTTIAQNMAENQNAQNIFNSPNNRNENTQTGGNTRAKAIKRTRVRKALRFTGKATRHFIKRTGQLTVAGIGAGIGIVAGNPSKALAYGAGGWKAGGAITKRATDSIVDLGEKTIKTAKSSVHTFRENAFGEEFTQFRESAEGEEIIRNYSRQEVQQCLAGGIENPSEMKILLKNYKQVGSLEDAIKYHQMSQYCQKNGLNTAKEIEKALIETGIDETQAIHIRQNMEKLKM